MRSWITLLVLAFLTLVKGDERPKRGGDYGLDVSLLGYGDGAAIGAYDGTGQLSTVFNCANMPFPGIYADVHAGCKSFHVCGATGGTGSTFYCPKDTMFNQQLFVCDWWYNVDCEASPQHYDLNAKLQGKGSSHYGGSAKDNGHDIFQALVTAKESASIAAEHAEKAADAAGAAKIAAEAKQISARQQIHAIKASAQTQLNAARRAAQLATSHAHSRAAAAHRSAAAFEAETLSRANAAISDASALKVEANVQFAIAKAATEAQKRAQVANLHLDIQEEVRNKALDHQDQVAQSHTSQPQSVNVGHLVADAAAHANGQAKVANLHLAIQEASRNKHLDHQARASQAKDQRASSHLVGAVTKVIANAGDDANGQAQVVNLHLAIQEKARQQYHDHRVVASQSNGHLAAAIPGVISNAAQNADGKSRVANLHLEIQEKARQNAFDHKERAAQRSHGHGSVAGKISHIVDNAAAVASGKENAARQQLAIQQKVRKYYSAHHNRRADGHRRHYVRAAAGAKAAAKAKGKVRTTHQPKDIKTSPETAEKPKAMHNRRHVQDSIASGSSHLTEAVTGVIAEAAGEASGTAQVANLQLDIQEKVRQNRFDHKEGPSHGGYGDNGAATIRRIVANAAAEASQREDMVRRQLSIQDKVRQHQVHVLLADHQNTAELRSRAISDIVANAAADASNKEAAARRQLAIQDKARQYSFAHQQKAVGHRRHYVRSAIMDNANASRDNETKDQPEEGRPEGNDNDRAMSNVTKEVMKPVEKTVEPIDSEQDRRANAKSKEKEETKDQPDESVIQVNADDVKSKEKEQTKDQPDESRIQANAAENAMSNVTKEVMKPAKSEHEVIKPANVEHMVSEQNRRANDEFKEKEETKDQPDESRIHGNADDSAMSNITKEVIKPATVEPIVSEQDQTGKHHKGSAEMSPAANIAGIVTENQEATVPAPHQRKRRGYHGGYIDIEQIIQNAASGASLQADTARLYVDIRAKARQQYYDKLSRPVQQYRGHHRRQAAATGRSDVKAGLAGKENEKQSAMHYGDEKEADATKVTTNPTSEADSKANPINPESHQRKARGIHPCHRCNDVWQIIDNAASEANGQAEVARLNLQIQEKARQSYYRQHQQTHYGH